MKKITLDVHGKRVTGSAAFARGQLWVHVEGETFCIETEARSKRTSKGRGRGRHDSGEIVAPMPGKIIKILAKSDEAVEEGQVLLIMEAMKMEYTLKAQASGRIEAIQTQAGDQVTLGQILIKLDTK